MADDTVETTTTIDVSGDPAAISEALAPEPKAKAPAKAKATEPAVDLSQYVPVFRDEDGELIPRNSILRVATTEKVNGNLRALDGTLITPEPVTDLHGPDIRDGDWFTTQYRAGFIRVDTVKKIR